MTSGREYPRRTGPQGRRQGRCADASRPADSVQAIAVQLELEGRVERGVPELERDLFGVLRVSEQVRHLVLTQEPVFRLRERQALVEERVFGNLSVFRRDVVGRFCAA